ncbi:exonuclease SbcCD subunit D [Fibrobacter sp. UWB10]|uniref:exonuclease SbcCD subunit D n=1 Tax=Fibrobacter sp. UWB10 TaxID=1896201 RepID=UPI002402DEE1|nr:exonuclease SbcCD subunit D [Fibrobacter sp. UWB10]SMP43544.1 Exodeoxyribonuclease I subunit D [Fibrobacter sp. UWB10]
MKFIHTADLHIGKSVCEHSMLDEQRFILASILDVVKREKPDAFLVAGDVYDKSVPSAEAVAVLDDFLVRLSETGTKVFVLSGNHDSAERIAFGGRLMADRGVYMSPVYSGAFTPVTLKDESGEVDVWMLPFVRPATVRACLESDEDRAQVTDYTSAMRMAIAQMKLTAGRRNVLLAHQFVTGAERSDSEENVGGLDNVDASVFEGFDYVALGHIHKPQNVAKDEAGMARVRYSGTPLKYSLSEASHKKSLTVIELGVKAEIGLANIHVREIPLTPEHDVREIRGTFAELVSPEFQRKQLADGFKLDDYVYVKLTDENDVPDAALKLRGIYPNLMMLDYDNERTRNQKIVVGEGKAEQKTPMELFGEFFSDMTKRELNEEEREFVRDMIESIWEEK